MSGLFAGTSLERPVTCEACDRPLDACECPRDARGNVCRPTDQRITVRRERRKGGRDVTVARGFDPVASDLDALLRTLRSTCGAGGAVKHEDGVSFVEVQGDHIEKVADVIRSLGYPVRGA